jgi:hypothetical protein
MANSERRYGQDFANRRSFLVEGRKTGKEFRVFH